MNISEKFEIILSVYYRVKEKHFKYRMNVEHYYSSPQVERFLITAGSKSIKMEKRLNSHKSTWKITEGKFENTNFEATATAIRDLQDRLDDYLGKRNKEIDNNRIFG